MPLVSVVIATYNRAAWLPLTLDSVLSQSHRDIEVIVVDDGSTDDTAKVIAPYLDRVRYVRQANTERGAARNAGLRLANGEFIAFLDSDDLWLPNKLEVELARFAREPKLGLVYSDAVYIDENGNRLGDVQRYRFEGDVLRQITQRNFVAFGAHLVRRELLEANGGFNEERELAGSEDWELWARLAARTTFGYSGTVGLRYRLHGGGSVADPDAMHRSMRRAAALIHENPDLAPRIMSVRGRTEAYVELVTASLHYSVNRPGPALRSLLSAARYSPTVIGSGHFLRLAAGLMIGRRVSRMLRP